MLDKLEVYLAVIAALIMAIISIVQRVTLFDMTVRMISVIILFYILGFIVKVYLRAKVFPEKKDDDEPAEGDDESEVEKTSVEENSR